MRTGCRQLTRRRMVAGAVAARMVARVVAARLVGRRLVLRRVSRRVHRALVGMFLALIRRARLRRRVAQSQARLRR